MNSLLWLLFFIAVSIPIAARLSRDRKQKIIYMWPWGWLVRKITELSVWRHWRLYGDIAIALVVGPILAWRFIEYRKQALVAFFGYLLFIFVLLPAVGGSTFLGSSLFNILFVTVFGFGGYALLLVGVTAYSIILGYFSGVHPSPGLAPALPGVSVGGFQIPLVEGVLALVIALLVHEGAHGVVALRERIPVKAGGIITIGLLPIGAYVEPDEMLFRKARTISRARVLSAGPVANLVVFTVFAMLLVAMSPISQYLSAYDCAHSSGVRILEVPETLDIGDGVIKSPSYGVLEAGDVILEMNGQEVNCVSQFFEILAPIRESEGNVSLPITVLRDGNEFNVSIVTDRGYIGIRGVENVYDAPLPFWYHVLSFIFSLISWISLLNFMIGLVNMLPLPPLDGGYIYHDLLEDLGLRRVYRFVLWLTIAILVINVLPWFV